MADSIDTNPATPPSLETVRALVTALCFPARLPMQPAGTDYEKKRLAAAAEAVKDADAIIAALKR